MLLGSVDWTATRVEHKGLNDPGFFSASASEHQANKTCPISDAHESNLIDSIRIVFLFITLVDELVRNCKNICLL